MTTRGQFNSKSPTIRRILKEAKELSTSPSPIYHAAPLEENLFEWHFTLRGPPSPSDFAGGIYHGRIVLPNSYPLRPPSFRFLTPTGRFEVNREICLSISGHHEETWQPAWGIRTALVAIRSFMDSDAMGQLGGMNAGKAVRHRFAEESKSWKCSTCSGKSNEEIMKEREAECHEAGENAQSEDEAVPDELRLGYREEFEKPEGETAAATKNEEPISTPSNLPPSTSDTATATATATTDTQPSSPPARSHTRQTSSISTTTVVGGTTSQLRTPAPQVHFPRQSRPNVRWIDAAIAAVATLLLALLLRRAM